MTLHAVEIPSKVKDEDKKEEEKAPSNAWVLPSLACAVLYFTCDS